MNSLKRKMGFFGTVVRLVGAAALMVGVMAGQQAVAGIANTKHNLSSGGTGPNHTSATDQICVFCHTPHGSDTTAPVPLWNKKLPSGASFTTYAALNTSSLDGGVLTVGSVSLACLSCHDGTQAMDNMLNKPGTGGYNAAGAGFAAGTWTGAQTMTGTPIPVLGTDLKNDHPIGVEYCGGGLTGAGAVVSGTCRDSDFDQANVKTATINTNQVFWVEKNSVAGRQKDDIALYTRDFTGTRTGAGIGPSVECASCHDPHVESKGSDNIMFMRVTTAGSQICLSCHTK